MGQWRDPVGDRVRRVGAFVVVLALSRHMSVHPGLQTDQRTWTVAHVAALEFLCGARPRAADRLARRHIAGVVLSSIQAASAVRRRGLERILETEPTAAIIPLVDLGAAHAEVAMEVADGWAEVLANTAFVLGPDVQRFEAAFASFSAIEHCVGVASGTDALELALRVLGVGQGDEVIVPTNSFIASAVAVSRTGATPVLIDAEPETQLLDLAAAEARIGPHTKVIMPVHLFGQMAPMDEVMKLAKACSASVIEDAAQCQGASQKGRTPGAFGNLVATSFYPGKNLGAYGDAGAVMTNSTEVADRLRALRNYGSNQKYHHPELGFNSRLDTLQAVVLHAKLGRLERWNEERRKAAGVYEDLLASVVPEVARPQTAPGNVHVWHLYVVRVSNRDTVLERLHQSGIGAGVHYPIPIHLQRAYAQLGHRPGDFPVAERLALEVISLPMFPGITQAQQERVVDALANALR